MMQMSLWKKPVKKSDIVYTPRHISEFIVRNLKPKGICLDPCKGDGAFYDYFPENKDYCEISEGKDFFDYSNKVDWIIGNPPYSLFVEFLNKSFEISDNVSFLVPVNKVFQRQNVMELINEYGGIKSMIVFGHGQLIGFPFGFSVGNFHFKRGYKGGTQLMIGLKEIWSKL